tara:strand:- start:566 stop:679 length:114 start_codon:yes stop_codon:yes gene_type:complete
MTFTLIIIKVSLDEKCVNTPPEHTPQPPEQQDVHLSK